MANKTKLDNDDNVDGADVVGVHPQMGHASRSYGLLHDDDTSEHDEDSHEPGSLFDKGGRR